MDAGATAQLVRCIQPLAFAAFPFDLAVVVPFVFHACCLTPWPRARVRCPGAAQETVRPATADTAPLSSDALEELRRALDPASAEQIVTFAVEIEAHHSFMGKSVAAAVGGGVLQELQAADEGAVGTGGSRDFGGMSDWHRCVDGLKRSGVTVGESEARSWLQRAKR